MPSMPEPGRLASHVYLDMVTAYDDDADGPLNDAAMHLAFERLEEIGAVEATRDDETDELHLDVSGVVGGAVVPLKWLVGQLAVYSHRSEEDVIVGLREFLDAD